MSRSIIRIALISMTLYTATQAMEPIKKLSLGLQAIVSLGVLAYTYAQLTSQPAVKIVAEHTPGIEGKPDHYLLFTLYKTSDKTRIGSICAYYYPSTHAATIEFLSVSEEYQKCGYGKQLWNTMIDALEKQDVHRNCITWKALPIGLAPSAINTQEYRKRLNTLVTWYIKRGGVIIKKNSTEAHMALT